MVKGLVIAAFSRSLLHKHVSVICMHYVVEEAYLVFILIHKKWLVRGITAVLLLGLTFGVLAWAFPDTTKRAVTTMTQPKKEVPIYYVEKSSTQKELSISFDATWGADYTAQILDILDNYEIVTTFFLCGRWIKEYPKVTQSIAERGHEIGNHSLTHPHMTQISQSQMEHEVMETHRLIREVTGQESRYFRCPFGEYNNQVITMLRQLNYLTIQWDVDSLDWRPYADADYIYNRVTSNVKPGSIVLFHNNATHTAEALPRIIEHLYQEGYKILPLSELLIKENWFVDPISGMQRHRR